MSAEAMDQESVSTAGRLQNRGQDAMDLHEFDPKVDAMTGELRALLEAPGVDLGTLIEASKGNSGKPHQQNGQPKKTFADICQELRQAEEEKNKRGKPKIQEK